jgi:hypothetical protein
MLVCHLTKNIHVNARARTHTHAHTHLLTRIGHEVAHTHKTCFWYRTPHLPLQPVALLCCGASIMHVSVFSGTSSPIVRIHPGVLRVACLHGFLLSALNIVYCVSACVCLYVCVC